MSDLDHTSSLDRAFEALTRDLAHSPGPGAAAAMSTVRRRRHKRVGAVALAALVVVGGGLTVPRLLSPTDGVAANGGETRFDAAHLEEATVGWTAGWEDWEQYSPKGGGSFSPPPCSTLSDPFADTGPSPTSGGSSRFVGDELANGRLALARYADAASAETAQTMAYPAPDTCGTTTTYDVDGVQVRHDSMPQEDPAETGSWLGDIWSVRIGAERAEFQVYGRSGVADPASAERVAELLVAGLRDGWTQSGMHETLPEPPNNGKGALPDWPDVDLTGALAGWGRPSKGAAPSSPNTPCLRTRLNDVDAQIVSAGGSPRGVSYGVTGYADAATGPEKVAAMVEELAGCTFGQVQVQELPDGVWLATYDATAEYDRADARGALWFAANGDRVGFVGVDRADRPMPPGVRDDVAEALLEILHLPWE